MRFSIFWFRNDLRLDDNPALHKAIYNSDRLLPLYIFDENEYSTFSSGVKKVGDHRFRFILESLEDLRNNLKRKNSDLLILKGEAVLLFKGLCEKFTISKIYSTYEYGLHEKELEKKISLEVPLEIVEGNTLYSIPDLPFKIENLPKHFTAFREKLEKVSNIQKILDVPETFPPLPERFKIEYEFEIPQRNNLKKIFIGGTGEAMHRVQYYFFQSRLLSNYKNTRDQISGFDNSSKLSPYLSRGCISPKRIYFEIQKYETEIEKNESTYWLYFELLWRDYFKFVALQKREKLFLKDGWAGESNRFNKDVHLYERWAKAKLGEPLIDSFINELNQTGYMSNRGRQIVASYFAKELKIDWRWGAEWFESQLIDYDVASNYGNWAYQAGVGNDPRKDRTFNLKIQSQKYDPENKFINQWSSNPGI